MAGWLVRSEVFYSVADCSHSSLAPFHITTIISPLFSDSEKIRDPKGSRNTQKDTFSELLCHHCIHTYIKLRKPQAARKKPRKRKDKCILKGIRKNERDSLDFDFVLAK